MSGVTYDYMDNYIKALVPETTGILKEIEDYAKGNSVPIVQKDVANLLKFMVNLNKPCRILELGTAIGYSAILMCTNSTPSTKIVSVERDEAMVLKARENIKRYNLEGNIEVIEGDCLEVLENMEEEFDFIFIDAGKGHYNHMLPHCLRILRKDGMIFADNVLFRGMVASRELLIRRKITIVKRMQKYLNLVCKDPNLLTTVLPIGDGVAITKRKDGNL